MPGRGRTSPGPVIQRLFLSLLAVALAFGATGVAAERLEPFSVDPGLLGGPPARTEPLPAPTPSTPSPRPVKPAKPAAAPAESRAPQAGATVPPADPPDSKTAGAPSPAAAGTADASPSAIESPRPSDGPEAPASSNKPRKTRAKVAERTEQGATPLYDDPDYQPMQHTPASLREWTGANHEGPVLRRITPNPRGLPVESPNPRSGPAAAPRTPGGVAKTAQPPVPEVARSTEPVVVPPARTSLRGMEAFEVDPALLAGATGAAVRPAPRAPMDIASPALQQAAKPAPTPNAAQAPPRTVVAVPPATPSARLEPFVVDPELVGRASASPRQAAAPPSAPAVSPPQAGGPPVLPGVASTRAGATRATPSTAVPPALSAAGDPSLEIEARRIDGVIDKTVTATGEAYIRKGWDELFGDVLRWNIATREASGEGNVVKRDRDSEVTGTRFDFNQATRKGRLDDATFSITSLDAKGSAGRVRFDGPGRLIGEDGVKYTTCDFNDPDWLLKADSIEIDQNANEGVARNARILAGGKYPLFYLPKYQFALKNERKSGFLTPLAGITNRTGPQVFIPYYWNIAPNYDATITTRLMTTRGVQVGGEFRYLNERFGGEARAEYAPDDRQFGDHRWALAFDHRHNLTDRLYGILDYQQVSDDFYFRDLRNTIGASSATAAGGARSGIDPGAVPGVRGGTSTRLLAQSALLDYAGDGWNLSSQFRSFQVLQPDTSNPVIQPYQALPNIRFSGARNIAGLAESRLTADFAAYSLRYPEPGTPRREGNRTILNPSISVPMRNSWGFLEPKLSYHLTHYALEPLAGQSDSFTRSLPTLSLDSGLTFERKASDSGAIQTLEPRLFYAYTPFRSQLGLPVFDTGRFDFNFAEIFSANRFVGNDRIGDANQVTAGFTSRYIDNKGTERVKVTLAQRFTLADLKVADDIRSIVDRSVNPPGAIAAPQKGVSDVLGEFSGRLFQDTSLVSRVQYNTDTSEVQRGLVGLRYNPEMGKVINVGYRYTREISDAQLGLQQVDFSTQWPLTSNLYALARTNYSLLDRRQTEGLLGLEYYGSCWSVRAVVQSLSTSATTSTRALFIVLELNGLTGTDPTTYNAILNRHIGGYSAVTPDQLRTTDAMIQ